MRLPTTCHFLAFVGCGITGASCFVSTSIRPRNPRTRLHSSVVPPPPTPPEESYNVAINEFFKRPVAPSLRQRLELVREESALAQPQVDYEFFSHLLANPGSPGVPRPLWLVLMGSVPTGLLYYLYYKFAVEEELFELELARGETPKGFGGYGTVGPFVFACIFGPFAFIFHLPGGLFWTYAGIAFVYYTQYLLYTRVNRLYKEEGREEPLTPWWCLPIFFPFDVIAGLRQVHFLSQYNYRQRGVAVPPTDPVVDILPFIGKETLSWPEFFLTPSLWFGFLSSAPSIDKNSFPEPVQTLLDVGEGEKYEIKFVRKEAREESPRTDQPARLQTRQPMQNRASNPEQPARFQRREEMQNREETKKPIQNYERRSYRLRPPDQRTSDKP